MQVAAMEVKTMVEVKKEVEVTVAVGGKVQQPSPESNDQSSSRRVRIRCVPST